MTSIILKVRKIEVYSKGAKKSLNPEGILHTPPNKDAESYVGNIQGLATSNERLLRTKTVA